MRNQRHAARARSSGGFTLLEVLIALVVLSIGVLGLAASQTVTLQLNTGTYYRSQATALAYDLVERMRGNRQSALNNLYDGGFEQPAPACDPALTGGTPAEDLAAWRGALACRLPQGNGQVTRDGNVFTITVRWDDSRGEGGPEQFLLTTEL